MCRREPGNYLAYPALTFTANGSGVTAATVAGPDYHPSACYVLLNQRDGVVGDIRLVAPGRGPIDGFTGYDPFGFAPPDRPNRWGDHSGAAVDGDTSWISSGAVAQSCTLTEYIAAPFVACGGTRNAVANWSTQLSTIRP